MVNKGQPHTQQLKELNCLSTYRTHKKDYRKSQKSNPKTNLLPNLFQKLTQLKIFINLNQEQQGNLILYKIQIYQAKKQQDYQSLHLLHKKQHNLNYKYLLKQTLKDIWLVPSQLSENSHLSHQLPKTFQCLRRVK